MSCRGAREFEWRARVVEAYGKFERRARVVEAHGKFERRERVVGAHESLSGARNEGDA